MKPLKITILLSVFLTLAGCPMMDYDYSFRFSNNSTRDVYIYLGVIGRDNGGTLYPDTAVAEVKCGVLFKKEESRFYSYSRTKKDIWTDTLSLFIFDADTFDTHNWEEIKNDYKILQRYDLSPQDIKQLDYKITYPPTGAMKDMKMFPPYGQ